MQALLQHGRMDGPQVQSLHLPSTPFRQLPAGKGQRKKGDGLPLRPTEPCSTALGRKVMGSLPEGAHLSPQPGKWGLRLGQAWRRVVKRGGGGELVPSNLQWVLPGWFETNPISVGPSWGQL